MGIRRINRIISSILVISLVGGGAAIQEVSAAPSSNTTTSGSSTAYYDTYAKVPKLGNYEFEIETHEIPSHEVLPIVGKEYFPYTTAKYISEVDNTPPSAVYKAKGVAKVDVVFALGKTDKAQALQDYIPAFTQRLQSAGNYIDANVQQVETDTIDMSSFGAREIFNTWRKMPVAEGRGDLIWELDEARGSIFAEGVVKKGDRRWTHRSTAIIDASPQAFETGDLTIEFDYYAYGSNGELDYHNVENGWSNHQSGLLFRYTEDSLGHWNTYALLVGDANAKSYRGNLTGKCGLSLVKVYNGDVDWSPGTYGGHLFISWCTGVTNPDGSLSYPSSTYYGGGAYGIGEWRIGENSPGNNQQVCALASKAVVDTQSHSFRVVVQGDRIQVYCGGILQLDVVDTYGTPVDSSPTATYDKGTYGFFSLSSPNVHFSNVKIERGKSVSLGEAISDVAWRDSSNRFIIYAEDEVPEYMEDTNNEDYQYTLTKLLNSGGYLINLGTDYNRSTLKALTKSISTPADEMGTFFLNSPINTAMNKSSDWIIEKVRNLIKPVDYILVNTEVLWDTEYKDQEHDLPLNFGEHDGTQKQPQDRSDEELANAWSVGLSHLYTSEKINAEKWRYRHFNNYYDNSSVREGFHGIWIEDPVEVFPYPGLYRINYKRKDNPLHPNVDLNDVFADYRYWSTDYDPLPTTTTPDIPSKDTAG